MGEDAGLLLLELLSPGTVGGCQRAEPPPTCRATSHSPLPASTASTTSTTHSSATLSTASTTSTARSSVTGPILYALFIYLFIYIEQSNKKVGSEQKKKKKKGGGEKKKKKKKKKKS